jgi:protein involved in polysaccharide export with SLBB domain
MIGVFGSTGAALAIALTGSSGVAVNVSGAVHKPGSYVISSPQSLSSAIREMGGFSLEADKRRVKVTSACGTVKTVDLTQLGTIAYVKPGDTVDVPAIDPTTSVVVQGGVSQSGAFDFRPGMTVADAVKQAHPSQAASLESVKVLRRLDDGKVDVLRADLLAMSKGKAEAMPLKAGDTVVVPFGKSVQASDRELLTIVVIGLLILVLID